MKKFTKVCLMGLLFNMAMNSVTNAMNEEDTKDTISLTVMKKGGSSKSSSSSDRSVKLEEGIIEEEKMENVPVAWTTRLAAYTARCAVIGCTTFIGGGIGLSIISGEVNPEVAWQLVKFGSPILFGTLGGYTVGWVCGNTIKARLTGKC